MKPKLQPLFVWMAGRDFLIEIYELHNGRYLAESFENPFFWWGTGDTMVGALEAVHASISRDFVKGVRGG